MPRRTRYQQGSVQREKRQSGYPTFGSSAGGKPPLMEEPNAGKQSSERYKHCRRKHPHSKLPKRCALTPTNKPRIRKAGRVRLPNWSLITGSKSWSVRIKDASRSRRAGYESYLNGWILPRWKNHRLDQVRSVAVEEWLDGIERAKATKAKIRNIMSAIFHHAMRYEWVERNPIKLVRQSAKRERVPDILELAELQLLLSKLSVRERTLALLDAATGLRVSELLALRWCDVDFENLELRVTRSIWHQVLGNCKTEASAKPVPMDSYMAEDLLRWRRQSVYASDDDYVFASETMRGKQPYWPDNLMKRHIQPVAKAIGIHKKIGWHTFRHSFGTLLKANGEDVKTVQELLRHANSRITLDVYTQAVNSNKRAAQSKVVRMMVPDLGQEREEKYPQTVR